MCDNCRKRNAELTAQIHAEMDDQEVPQDSILRGLASVQVACDTSPTMLLLMQSCWPTRLALVQ